MNSEAPIPPPVIAAAQPVAPPDTPPRFPFVLMFSVWLVVVLISTLVTLVLPEMFASTARIKVEQDQTDVRGLSDPPPTTRVYDPYYIQTQYEIIQSATILTNVIDNLNLNEVWGNRYNNGTRLKTAESLALFRGRLDLRPVRNTTLMDIRFYGENPAETAACANQVAESYRQWRFKHSRELVAAGLEDFELMLQRQNAKIRQMLEELAGLPEPAGNSQLLTASKLNYLEKQRTLDEAIELRRLLTRRIADAQIEFNLPRSAQVMIIERAMPGATPVRPNKPVNIWLGVLVGGLVSLLLAGLVYLLQRRVHRRKTNAAGPASLRSLRTFLRVTIALVVGVIVGYNCATPLSPASILILQLLIFLGGIALAFVELAKSTPVPDSSVAPVGSQLKDLPRSY